MTKYVDQVIKFGIKYLCYNSFADYFWGPKHLSEKFIKQNDPMVDLLLKKYPGSRVVFINSIESEATFTEDKC